MPTPIETNTATIREILDKVNGLPKGGGSTASPAVLKDVNFYDYEGTLLYSYTLDEAKALTALPHGPTHEGLVFQDWNWSLEDIKGLDRPMNVGAMYITDDGATRLNIRVWDLARSNVPLYFRQTVDSSVTIDWGDGSPIETLSGTGNKTPAHQYTSAGDYTISILPADESNIYLGDKSSGVFCQTTVAVDGRMRNTVYGNMLQSVHIGRNIGRVYPSAFSHCSSLKSISIPRGITRIYTSVFRYCYSLESIVIPDTVLMIDATVFNSCSSLASVSAPKQATVGNYCFQNCFALASIAIQENEKSLIGSFAECHSLASIIIPQSMTTIGAETFSNCFCLAAIHLKPTTPPTLSDVNAFTNIPDDCIIYVPKGCLEAYQTAANWSTYADKMQEEPA